MMLQLHDECPTDLAKYELLAQLAATNVSLLYYVLIHNLEQLAPIVYTPTVGEACQKFDRIFRYSLSSDAGYLQKGSSPLDRCDSMSTSTA